MVIRPPATIHQPMMTDSANLVAFRLHRQTKARLSLLNSTGKSWIFAASASATSSCAQGIRSEQMFHVKHSGVKKAAASRWMRRPGSRVRGFAGSRFMRLREVGPDRKGYSSSSTAGATTSGMDAVGSKRRTTLPSRSTRNFVKFHLMSGLPA